MDGRGGAVGGGGCAVGGWTAIVCTCQNRESANTFRKELNIRQQKGLISSEATILAVDDPKPDIGSGSATLNALISLSEVLAAKEGHKVVTTEVLYKQKILILLLGATFPFSPCGHAFMPVQNSAQPWQCGQGFENTEVKMNIDRLIEVLSELSASSPPGVWVASTDMILEFPRSISPLDMSTVKECVGALTVRVAPEYAMSHGACKINEKGEVSRITHQAPEEVVKAWTHSDGTCDMLTGIVYLSPIFAEMLVHLHTAPPLDACTYYGLDNGAQPLSLSLFFDILLCLTTDMTEEEYTTSHTHQSGSHTHQLDDSIMKRARVKLWRKIRKVPMKAVPLVDVKHYYLRHTAVDVQKRYISDTDKNSCINSKLAEDTTIGKGSLILNCNLGNPVIVGSNCFLSGLSDSFLHIQSSDHRSLVTIPAALTVQEIRVYVGTSHRRFHLDVGVVYGTYDMLTASYDSETSTYCNRPWREFFNRTGIQPEELWPCYPRQLLTAKLFVGSYTDPERAIEGTFWLVNGSPSEEDLISWRSAWRFSLKEILKCVDTEAEFKKIRNVSFQLQQEKMVKALKTNQPLCFLPFFKHSLVENRQYELLSILDNVVHEVQDKPLIICRIYACIADILAYMSSEVGIRGGPAANVAWKTAFNLLEKGSYMAATQALAVERQNWINGGSDRIIRASRHYERAGQIITRMGVASAKTFIEGKQCAMPDIGQPVEVQAPARVDISGGWTDTPPQAYEWGGVVVTLAIKINGQCPIKCIATRIKEPKLDLVLHTNGSNVETVEVRELSQMLDYSQPHAPGALLKAAFICGDVVKVLSPLSLAEQLQKNYGSGFRLETFSNVPQGSGLGTSSILGGVIMAALWKAAGQRHSNDSLIHAVLYLEQLLTTGGGWQDQCGGLYGGAKISKSETGLPVKIYTETLATREGFLAELSQHLLLIYTGRTRLARNLLQDVLRNWHSRETRIVKTMADLVANALEAAEAFKNGSLSGIGECLSKYREQKLIMAPGSLPKSVQFFIEKAQNLLHGCALTGAGGGGFLAAILKDSAHKEKVAELIKNHSELSEFRIFETSVDEEGLMYN